MEILELEIRLFPKNKEYMRNLFIWFSQKCKYARVVYNAVSDVQELPWSLFRSGLSVEWSQVLSFSAQRQVTKMSWFLSPHNLMVVVILLCFALSPFVESNCSLNIGGVVRGPRQLPGAEVSSVDFDWLKCFGYRWPSAASYLLVSPSWNFEHRDRQWQRRY